MTSTRLVEVEEVRVFVAGGFDADGRRADEIRAFCRDMGRAVATHGHTLLNGARTELDALVAQGAWEALQEIHTPDGDRRIVGYVLSGLEPVHTFGTLLRSQLANWELESESFYVPEPIAQADVVVLVGGFGGTLVAANWAEIARKPLLPFASFGGASAKIYKRELKLFDGRYGDRLDRIEFEQLNSIKSGEEHAADILALAEKIVESRSVLVVMSYADRPDLKDAFGTFKRVCADLGYDCDRVSAKNAEHRIVSEILERVRRAAFTIVDLTDLRPNVFYELGYAEGLGRRVIVTAKRGTELPYDVKDIPTILWDSYEDLGDDLRARIDAIIKSAVKDAGPPIGPG